MPLSLVRSRRIRRRTRPPRRRLALTALAAAALLSVPAATAGATTASAAPARAGTTSTATAGEADTLASRQLNITMQAQQQSNWCWAAAGNTIASFYGRNYSQNQFCNAAFGRQQGYDCPNWQATLGDVQQGLRWAGVRPGSYVTGWLYYSTVQAEIDAGRPVETRIGWDSGGGHMHVLYGYDTSGSLVYWGDPWPSSGRYNWASHAWYVNNNSFDWTHSLYRIGA